MMNTPVWGMYKHMIGPYDIEQFRKTEEFHREQKKRIREQQFAKIQQCMNVVEAYYLAKTKKLEEAQQQKESLDTQSSLKVIYKHQDQQAKL